MFYLFLYTNHGILAHSLDKENEIIVLKKFVEAKYDFQKMKLNMVEVTDKNEED